MSSQPAKALRPRPERRQRRHARYRIEFPVIVVLLSEGEHRRIDAHCRDLSTAGIGMLIAAELKLGEVARLNFTLPGSPQAWELRAVLRHRRGYHYGFEFLSIRAEDTEFLTAYLPKLEREDHEPGLRARREDS